MSETNPLDKSFVEFDRIRKDCIRKGIKYEDPEFPAIETSVYFSQVPKVKFEWQRPPEIVRRQGIRPPTAHFFQDGPSRFDIAQGNLGDCWLLASIAVLAENRDLLHRVVPRGQGFNEDWYSGIFRFRFWRFGEWIEVNVDDRVPTLKNELCFLHSSVPTEFWGSLLEKAYAKVNGSYEALKGGVMRDAMTDLTGGLTESYVLRGQADVFMLTGKNVPRNLEDIMFKALERQSLICCLITPSRSLVTDGRLETLPNGLVAGHAYSITDMREIQLITNDDGIIPIILIRVRNPWGNRVEWNGRWGDKSTEWNTISVADRELMGLVIRDDGEFWMDLSDFLDNFDMLEICNLTPDAPLDTARKWVTHVCHGRWIAGFNAGGRPSSSTFWANPQYRVTLQHADEGVDNMCSFVVELMQKDRRGLRHRAFQPFYIGFAVYRLEDKEVPPFSADFFAHRRMVGRADYWTNTRQVVRRFLFPPGTYLVVPTTYDRDQEADFMIRFFFENENQALDVNSLTAAAGVEIAPSPQQRTPPDRVSPDLLQATQDIFFRKSGEAMAVDAIDFRQIINSVLQKDLGISLSQETCRMLMLHNQVSLGKNSSAASNGFSSNISLPEFLSVYNNVILWMEVFRNLDKQAQRVIPAFELRTALRDLGYSFPSDLLALAVFTYANQARLFTCDAFVRCTARLAALSEMFRQNQVKGTLSLSLNQWYERSLLTGL